jgi:hypothetical protein
MTLTEVIDFLRANEGRRVLVTWSDGESQHVDINGVDDHRIERAFSSSVSGLSTSSCDFLVDPLNSYSE